jgi:hypothetical protein
LEQVQAELEQVQAELVQAELVQAELVQAELVQAPAQLHDQTISDAPLLREIYGVGQKQAWHLAAPLRAPAA